MKIQPQGQAIRNALNANAKETWFKEKTGTFKLKKLT